MRLLFEHFGVALGVRAVADVAHILSMLREHGAVLLREVAGSDHAASLLGAMAAEAGLRRTHHILGGPAAAAAASRGMFDPVRLRPIITADGSRHGWQGVEPGSQAIEPHQESGYLPWWPEIVAFFCRVPARTGGETILVDGVELWSRLSSSTRELFARTRLRFDNVNAVITDLLGLSPDAPLVRSWSDLRPDLTGKLFYYPSAVVRTARGEEAFCNSIVGPYPWKPRLEDGNVVPEAILEDVRRGHREVSADLHLDSGDLIILDNNRVLHGRRAFVGERDMYIYMYTSKPVPDSLITAS
jgi:alpha-ketoglutarate-dependent taurine dioxygenase